MKQKSKACEQFLNNRVLVEVGCLAKQASEPIPAVKTLQHRPKDQDRLQSDTSQ